MFYIQVLYLKVHSIYVRFGTCRICSQAIHLVSVYQCKMVIKLIIYAAENDMVYNNSLYFEEHFF